MLKRYDLEKEAIMLITLMLSKSTKGIEAFLYVSHYANITSQEEFLKLAVLIAEYYEKRYKQNLRMKYDIDSLIIDFLKKIKTL